MQRSWLALATVVLNAELAFADVRVVAPTGAPYAEIQAAVDAASDGDVVLVESGTYASFVIRNLEVAVVADAGALVNVDGAIRVSGLALTRTVLLSGLVATGRFTAQPSTRHGLFARNCAGAVRVVGCQLTGVPLNLPTETCYDGQGAYLENCADVALIGCVLKGSEAAINSNGTPGGGAADGGHGIFADASTVVLYDDTLRGGKSGAGFEFAPGYGNIDCEPPPYQVTSGYTGSGGDGYRGRSSFLFASNSLFLGAAGWDSGCYWDVCTCAGSAGHGIVHDGGVDSGFLLGCNMAGGLRGANANYCAAITVHVCAQDCGGPFGPSGLPVVGAVTSLTGPTRRMTAPRVLREGQLATFQFLGQPADQVELVVSERTGFRFLPQALGVVLVRLTRPQLVQQAGTLGPAGTLTQTWPVGELGSSVQARLVYVQAAMVDPTGQSTLSSPAVVVLLDAAF